MLTRVPVRHAVGLQSVGGEPTEVERRTVDEKAPLIMKTWIGRTIVLQAPIAIPQARTPSLARHTAHGVVGHLQFGMGMPMPSLH